MRRLGWVATARLAALSAVLLVASAGTAAAATNPTVPPALCAFNSYKVIKGSGAFVRVQPNFNHGKEWRAESMSDGQAGSLALTRVVTTANSWSLGSTAKTAIPAGDISATVGFNVTETQGFNATRTISIPAEPPGTKTWFVEAGTKDRVSTFKFQTFNCRGEAVGTPKTGQAVESGELIYRSGSYDLPG
jgi:hypothetical protein